MPSFFITAGRIEQIGELAAGLDKQQGAEQLITLFDNGVGEAVTAAIQIGPGFDVNQVCIRVARDGVRSIVCDRSDGILRQAQDALAR